MLSVVTWTSIELLHNVVKTLTYFSTLSPTEGGLSLPVVSYRAKIKLHGTNCAVQVHADGIVTQSRTTILTPKDDLKGFSKWAHAHETFFRSLQPGIVIFGEWCGPGIEMGMAVSALTEKQWAVFGIQVGVGDDARIVYDPTEIAALLKSSTGQSAPANLHILPWMDFDVTLDYSDSVSLDSGATVINRVVQGVEEEDPWVKATFNLSGLGEGIVLYPVKVAGREVPTHPDALARLMFKAKGLKHRTVGTREAAQVAPTSAVDATGFVSLVVTEARLQQGVSIVCGGERDLRRTREFIAWVVGDVQKEAKAELEASGLIWSQVERAVQTRAREWFVQK